MFRYFFQAFVKMAVPLKGKGFCCIHIVGGDVTPPKALRNLIVL